MRDLSAAFGEVKKTSIKLKEVHQITEQDGTESKEITDYDEEHSMFLVLDIRLKTYAEAKALIKTKNLHGGDEKVTTGTGVPLKINKPDALRFSGEAREFASFKQDFMAIVVPNRDNSQIGMHFKQAIPDKHKHLLSNKNLDDWESMMDIIEAELASPS